MTRPDHSPADDKELLEFFAPARAHRLSVLEKEQIHTTFHAAMGRSSSGFWSMFHIYSTVFTVFVLLVVSGTGLTFAQTALPGDFLYPLKRLQERVRTVTTPSAVKRAEVEVDLLDERLNEVEQLEQQGALNEQTTESLDADFRTQRDKAVKKIEELEIGNVAAAPGALEKVRGKLRESELRYENNLRPQHESFQMLKEMRKMEEDFAAPDAANFSIQAGSGADMDSDDDGEEEGEEAGEEAERRKKGAEEKAKKALEESLPGLTPTP